MAGRIQELSTSVVLDCRRVKPGVWSHTELTRAGFYLAVDKGFRGGARVWANRWRASLWLKFLTILPWLE